MSRRIPLRLLGDAGAGAAAETGQQAVGAEVEPGVVAGEGVVVVEQRVGADRRGSRRLEQLQRVLRPPQLHQRGAGVAAGLGRPEPLRHPELHQRLGEPVLPEQPGAGQDVRVAHAVELAARR